MERETIAVQFPAAAPATPEPFTGSPLPPPSQLADNRGQVVPAPFAPLDNASLAGDPIPMMPAVTFDPRPGGAGR